MAELILEITYRNDRHYVVLNKPVLRLGRALDNDVILADPTVSPHHLVIKVDSEGRYWLYPVNDENGLVRDGNLIERPLRLDNEPLSIEAGRTHLHILPRDYPVAATRQLSCRSGTACLFGNGIWAAVLFGLFVAVSLIDNYWSTPQRLSWESFGQDQVVLLTVVLALAVGLTILVRLAAHRWEPVSALAFVSLMLLIATALEQISIFLNYAFTSAAPGFIADLGWVFLIAPVALYWFLVHVNHANRVASLLIISILMSPAAYTQSREIIAYYGLFDVFSKTAHYPQELSPIQLHQPSALGVDAYIETMHRHFDRN